MWLFIDTCERGSFRIGKLPAAGSVKIGRAPGGRGAFIPWLSAVLPRKDIAALRGIAVVEGPGSFSSIRTGVLVANMLSRLHRKPLYRLSRSESADLGRVRDLLAQGRLSPSSYVAPVYDREPNITCPS
jgi:tRNA A37 threonylcarbamoyladenosine modification protein TsaB